jgi:hypothetical protein
MFYVILVAGDTIAPAVCRKDILALVVHFARMRVKPLDYLAASGRTPRKQIGVPSTNKQQARLCGR